MQDLAGTGGLIYEILVPVHGSDNAYSIPRFLPFQHRLAGNSDR